MKTCFKCDTTKALAEFYRHPNTVDGRLGKCKECAKEDSLKNRTKRADYCRAYDRARASQPERKAYFIAKGLRTRKQNKGKYAAQTMVGNAVRDGKLAKLPCQVCGSTTRIHGHHEDYSRPLDVVWLCPIHHSARHKQLRAA